LGNPYRNKQWQDIVDKTRQMGKDTTEAVCNLGLKGEF